MTDEVVPDGGSAPRSQAGSGARAVVQRLDEAECLRLLGMMRLGRLVYGSRFGPMALPVEYRLHQGSIVFRTASGTFTAEDLHTGIADADYEVAFEVDEVNVETREGWIVLVRGPAHNLDTEAERASVAEAGVEPWVEGEPEHFIRVHPERMWGQRSHRA
jgi:nitroimidazol reductase NimA-like FMN-containing flavoprotein (pyridoxamine 5'-phosphate oxidase superfamily)